MAENQSYGLAAVFVGINATGTDATGILAFWSSEPVEQVEP